MMICCASGGMAQIGPMIVIVLCTQTTLVVVVVVVKPPIADSEYVNLSFHCYTEWSVAVLYGSVLGKDLGSQLR